VSGDPIVAQIVRKLYGDDEAEAARAVQHALDHAVASATLAGARFDETWIGWLAEVAAGHITADELIRRVRDGTVLAADLEAFRDHYHRDERRRRT
jgi:hypothetical protein